MCQGRSQGRSQRGHDPHLESKSSNVKDDIDTKLLEIYAISKIDTIKAYDDISVVKCTINNRAEIVSCFRKSPLSILDSNYNNVIFKIQGLIAYEKQFLMNLVRKENTLFSFPDNLIA